MFRLYSFLLIAAVSAAPQIADNSGKPVPPVGASGNVYPTNTVLGYTSGIPASQTATSVGVGPYTLVPNQDDNADWGMYLDFSNSENFQPLRGQDGSTDPGPRDKEVEAQNSDLYARPGTDAGGVPNAKWPMGLSSARPGTGGRSGWARQQNTDELPIAVEMAGVDMRLAPNAYRELRWHSAGEWSYVLNGSCCITAVTPNGESYVDDISAGDLWFFPPGVPHSIQATEQGVEFLLVFNKGDFSEDGTDLVSELFMRNPKEVLAKNLQANIGDFDNIPTSDLYIFDGTPMQDLETVRQSVTGPAGRLTDPAQAYTYHFSAQTPLTVPGGSVKIVDPTVFPAAQNFSVGLFTVEPGAMREIRWHLTSDEWNFFIQGKGRVTSFQAPQSSRTFDFQAGDVGYIPTPNSHYIENTGNETLIYLEVLLAPKYQDISVGQWLGLTPPQIIKDTLHLPDYLINRLPKTKQYVVPGNPNYSTTNFTVDSYPNAALNAKRGLGATVFSGKPKLRGMA